ncbi:isochorismate synthase [Streptomyces sp. NPDC048606]|uniref:isochorismate synthase n=1 Tax=Streptomyces sp. NPDC048606 TaxID=3154726 RepID=UPI003439E97E
MATPSRTAPPRTAPSSRTAPPRPAPTAPGVAPATAPPRHGDPLDPTDPRGLLATCVRAADRARRTGRPTLAAWAAPLPGVDPLALWGRARLHTPRALLWRSAWDQGSLIALGTAHDLRGHGADRVRTVREEWTRLARDLVAGGTGDDALGTGEGPLAVGGFAFAPDRGASPGRLPDTLMWVPALQIRSLEPTPEAPRAPGHAELRLNAVLSPGDDPERAAERLAALAAACLPAEADPASEPPAAPPSPAARTHTCAELPAAEDWKRLVRDATDGMRAGAFEKVVLARELRVTASRPFDVPRAVRRLREANPATTLFAVDHDGRTFLGATPEYLVRVDGPTVHALGLAGTTPRGATPEQDEAHERELVDSAKIRHEHEVVVRMLRRALADSCAEVDAETPPRVVKLATVQHLSTKVRGRLSGDSPTGVLDFVECLHPTPALGGHPRAQALDWLDRNEGLDRSWYAGAVGWADHRGQGQFAVAIRSALLDGATASLYAGCGLVADSDPQTEYEETCAKLQAMTSALEIE